MTRQAPNAHAALYPLGHRKKGVDGKMWSIVKTKNNVKRWKRTTHTKRRNITTSRAVRSRRRLRSQKRIKIPQPRYNQGYPKKKGTTYFIHDNGGRPFQVSVAKGNVSIYEQPNWRDGDTQDFTKLIKTYTHVKKVFIGKDNVLGKKFDGNSILVHLSGDRYLYIGSWIYEFSTKHDRIVDYFSQVGNSDVPYPVALGEKSVYFMLEPTKPTGFTYYGRRKVSRRAGVVPRDIFPPNTNWENAYTLFYGHGNDPPLALDAKKFYKVRIIQKRHW